MQLNDPLFCSGFVTPAQTDRQINVKTVGLFFHCLVIKVLKIVGPVCFCYAYSAPSQNALKLLNEA